jgi:uncharacterized OB-fold protein
MAGIEQFICKACGAKTYPRHTACPSCGATDFDSLILEGTATLVTFTRVHALSLAYTERFITVGIVEYQGGLRALGRLYVDEPRIGMSLETYAGIVRTEDSEETVGLCFRKAFK